jgi:uncharacterized protein (DUF427 family)
VGYYLDRGHVAFEHLVPSETVTGCPLQGLDQPLLVGADRRAVHPDLAWSYQFPVPALQAIAGLVAFYDEKVDVFLDGEAQPRPRTKFSEG